MDRVALIVGITGQDGGYLSKFLSEKGYRVHGVVTSNNMGLQPSGFQVHFADLTDGSNLIEILDQIQPDEVYNLAALSQVGLSFELPVLTGDITGVGTLRILEAIRVHQQRFDRTVRFLQASSATIYGDAAETPQNEDSAFHPRSPYACAKVYAYWQTVNYREAYKLFATNAILFNHESPHRSDRFVTRKITRAAARIKMGLQESLSLGNLDVRRDWGFAGDYVEAMWLMLQQDDPEDFVIATGESHTLTEFLEIVFSHLDLDWKDYVCTDENLKRKSETRTLLGDAGKARKVLGWKPSVSFQELACMMTDHDLELATREKS